MLFHVLNRGVGRMQIFRAEKDYDAFHRVVEVERNALRAGLVKHAEDWRWGSLRHRTRRTGGPLLGGWPLPQPSDWAE